MYRRKLRTLLGQHRVPSNPGVTDEWVLGQIEQLIKHEDKTISLFADRYTGVINNWAETGSEGFRWVFERDGDQLDREHMEHMLLVQKGDYLRILKNNRSVIFEGIIDPDHRTGWTEYPQRPGFGQPTALGMWIHWTQKGWEPDEWAKLFFNESLGRTKKPLRAELVRKK